MADRFFPNVMPSFVTEDIQEEDKVTDEDSLMKLLSMPYTSLSKQFQRSGLDLKETIVMETWGLGGQVVHDFTLYSGNLGTALLLYKSYQVTSNENDLFLCLEIVKACDSASRASRDVTFICGRAGVCALGAVAAKHANDEALESYYLSQLGEIKLLRNHPDELLYGRSGFLWACLFLNKQMGQGTVPGTTIRAVANEIIQNGRALAKKGGSPLMYEWYGERYWGAAHGLAVATTLQVKKIARGMLLCIGVMEHLELLLHLSRQLSHVNESIKFANSLANGNGIYCMCLS
ncbi:hypothetical protein D5086_025053 [Populus alba]|uniref:Uncharacterized protein n=1 Tax=Populus alba TaxID=43335 RepID=A0ACC4B7G1_POPAL